MSIPRQTLRKRWDRASEYAREHDLRARIESLGTVFIVLAFLCLVGAGLWVVWALPQWQVNQSLDLNHEITLPKQLELEDAYRKTIAQVVLSLFGLLILYFTWRRSVAGDRTVRIMEQGHITDRFTKAIEQLGKIDGTVPNIQVRLGAIYALERIALDSPRDHWCIMEILTAYVRQNAPLDTGRAYTEGETPSTDIQAILTVLGRRKTGPKRERTQHRLDLSSSRLCGAALGRANFKNSEFGKTNLQGAQLGKANLQNVNLIKANLEGANLQEADLQSAKLEQANLQSTNFVQANLQSAILKLAKLQSALLMEANLQSADLNLANLQSAYLEQANLQSANLFAANLQNAGFKLANLQNANLEMADLQDITFATPAQIQFAEHWEKASYSIEFRAELGLPPEDPNIPNSSEAHSL